MAGPEWEWANDDLKWTPYSPECSSKIEAAYTSGLKFLLLCVTHPSQPSHAISFPGRRHSQINLRSHFTRPVRRQSSEAQSSTASLVTWEWWASETGTWHAYDAAVGSIIETEWTQCCRTRMQNEANGPAGTILAINGEVYAIKFEVDAVQYNMTSLIYRGVRRRSPLPFVAPNPIQNAQFPAQSSILSQPAVPSGGESACPPSQTYDPADLADWPDPPVDQDCQICVSSLHESPAVKLGKCKHSYHRGCIEKWFKSRPTCPECATAYGMILGTQPSGEMKVRYIAYGSDEAGGGGLDGYPDIDIIQIFYIFPSGIQSAEHVNPGRPYTGTRRIAYLPKTKEGEEVLTLIKIAWDRRLLFRIGTSVSTGQPDAVIWSGIHHKTRTSGGPTNYGYPDDTYFTRVKTELADLGVK